MSSAITGIRRGSGALREGDAMKDHDDSSKGVRGKFYAPDAVFRWPVCLDEPVGRYLAAKADAKGVDLSPPGQ